jgi:hypothetical protein
MNQLPIPESIVSYPTATVSANHQISVKPLVVPSTLLGPVCGTF